MTARTPEQWYSVRCVFRFDLDEGQCYEERLTLWQARNAQEAIALAEREAEEYAAAAEECEYLGFAQSFWLFGPPRDGAEVFSLFRDSTLPPEEYLDTFFDTGREREGRVDDGAAEGPTQITS